MDIVYGNLDILYLNSMDIVHGNLDILCLNSMYIVHCNLDILCLKAQKTNILSKLENELKHRL